MHWVDLLWWVFVNVLPVALTLYVVGGIVFLLLVRSERGPGGLLNIDQDAWHFRIAHPFLRAKVIRLTQRVKNARSSFERQDLIVYRQRIVAKFNRRGICRYYARLFVATFLMWPLLGSWLLLKFVVYLIPALLFGVFPIPDIQSMEDSSDFFVFAVRPQRIWLPRVGHFPIFPIYIVLAVGYVYLLYLWPNAVIESSLEVLLWAVVGGLVISILVGTILTAPKVAGWFRGAAANNDSASLFREWFVGVWVGVCDPVQLKVRE